MQSAGRGASALVMITADLTCRPRGDAATAPVVISRCHNNCDYAQGAITLHSDLKYDNEMRSSRLILNTLHLMNPFLLLLIKIVKVFHMSH